MLISIKYLPLQNTAYKSRRETKIINFCSQCRLAVLKTSYIMDYQQPTPQQIIIQHQPPKSNGLGTAGFVLALIGLILCWIPILDWILWLLGLIFSFIGVFKAPRGLAIAGLIISFIGIIILIAIIGVMAAAMS